MQIENKRKDQTRGLIRGLIGAQLPHPLGQ